MKTGRKRKGSHCTDAWERVFHRGETSQCAYDCNTLGTFQGDKEKAGLVEREEEGHGMSYGRRKGHHAELCRVMCFTLCRIRSHQMAVPGD